MIKRVPGAGYALTLAVGLSAMIALSAVLVPRPSTLVFPVDHAAGFSPASRPQSIQPMGASITPITSVAAGSSGIAFSGDAYDVSCTVSAAAGTLYPAMHDGTAWTVYYAYPCALDGTVATKATCIFPARRGSGLTWNAFKTGAATINACTAEQRYTGGGLSAVPPPPASSAAAFDPASPGAIGGTTPAAGTFTTGTFTSIVSGANTLTLSNQLAASKLLIASQAAGDILYASSTTAWSRLGVGSNGQVLTLASGVPSWAAAPQWDASATLSTAGISQTIATLTPDTAKESTYAVVWQAHRTADRLIGIVQGVTFSVYYNAGVAVVGGLITTHYTHSWGGSTDSFNVGASGASVILQVTSGGGLSEHKVSYRLLQVN